MELTEELRAEWGRTYFSRFKGNEVRRYRKLLVSESIPNVFAVFDEKSSFLRYHLYGPYGFKDFAYVGHDGLVGVKNTMNILYLEHLKKVMEAETHDSNGDPIQ